MQLILNTFVAPGKTLMLIGWFRIIATWKTLREFQPYSLAISVFADLPIRLNNVQILFIGKVTYQAEADVVEESTDSAIVNE